MEPRGFFTVTCWPFWKVVEPKPTGLLFSSNAFIETPLKALPWLSVIESCITTSDFERKISPYKRKTAIIPSATATGKAGMPRSSNGSISA